MPMFRPAGFNPLRRTEIDLDDPQARLKRMEDMFVDIGRVTVNGLAVMIPHMAEIACIYQTVENKLEELRRERDKTNQ